MWMLRCWVEDFRYITNRDVKKGEELLENYLDYDDWKDYD